METGNKIKRVAKALHTFILVFSIIVGVAGAIISIAVSDGAAGLVFLGLLGGAAWITCGIFFAWVVKTLVLGFGELVENSEVIRKNTEPKAMPQSTGMSPKASAAKKYMDARQATAAKKSGANGSEMTSVKNPEAPKSVTKTRQSETVKPVETEGVCPIPANHNRIRCPKCYTVQPIDNQKCCKCGQAFIHE